MTSAAEAARQPQHPPRMSPTSIKAFDECPRRYAFEYLEKAAGEDRPSASLIFGNAVHAAMADLFRLPPEDRDEEIAHRILRHRWMKQRGREEAFLTKAEETAWGLDALAALSRFCATHADELEIRPIAVEDRISCSLGHDHAVAGRLDRADRISVPQAGSGGSEPGGVEMIEGLRITDYKTGRCRLSGPDELADDRGAQVYAVAATRRYRQAVLEVRFLFLVEDTEVVWRLEPDDIPEIEARLTADIDLIVAEREFEPRTGPYCGWCRYRAICPANELRPESFSSDPGTVF